jgi:hypothetical protein
MCLTWPGNGKASFIDDCVNNDLLLTKPIFYMAQVVEMLSLNELTEIRLENETRPTNPIYGLSLEPASLPGQSGGRS